jgi:raffinose/stachyose/melibiose transport system permease protein
VRVVLLARTGIFLALALFALLAVWPIFYMASASLKTSGEFIRDPLSLPASLIFFDNVRAVWIRFDIPRLFLDTIVYIALLSLISLSVSIPASFAIAKLRFPFRSLLRFMLVGTLIILVITYVVPSYVMMADLGLVDSYRSGVLLWAATSVPGNVFLLCSLMRGILDEILESARLDGAGYFELMRHIVIPPSFPALITVSIFNVTGW